MKKIVILWLSLMVINTAFCQSNAIKKTLKQRYPGAMIVEQTTGGGSYDIIYNYGTQSVKEGSCDLSGKEIIAPNKYSFVCKQGDYSDGYYYEVRIGDKVGACDLNGKEIIAPNKYSYVSKQRDYSDGYYYYKVKIGDKEGVCDLSGKEIIAPNKYSFVKQGIYGGYYEVRIGDKVGGCDLTGKEIIAPNKYTSVCKLPMSSAMNKFYYAVRIGDKQGACDLTGKEIVPCEYQSVICASEKFSVKLTENGDFVEYDSGENDPSTITAQSNSSQVQTTEENYYQEAENAIGEQDGEAQYNMAYSQSLYKDLNGNVIQAVFAGNNLYLNFGYNEQRSYTSNGYFYVNSNGSATITYDQQMLTVTTYSPVSCIVYYYVSDNNSYSNSPSVSSSSSSSSSSCYHYKETAEKFRSRKQEVERQMAYYEKQMRETSSTSMVYESYLKSYSQYSQQALECESKAQEYESKYLNCLSQ